MSPGSILHRSYVFTYIQYMYIFNQGKQCLTFRTPSSDSNQSLDSSFPHCPGDGCHGICVQSARRPNPRPGTKTGQDSITTRHMGRNIVFIGKVYLMNLWQRKSTKKETFRERRHLQVCDLWPWVVTLTLDQGQKGLCHQMSLIIYYCTLLPGMMSMGLLLYEISPFVYFIWHLTFTYDLQLLARSLTL